MPPLAPSCVCITLGTPCKSYCWGGTGKGKPSQIKESSALVVETVEKKPGAAPKKKFVGDASKVVAKGNGLQKAFMGRPATFTVDTKGAGQ